jgi:hypothetical protein
MMPSVPTAMTTTAVSRTKAATVAGAYATTIAAMATMTGHGRAVTAQQGDADNREENRDAKNQCSIHPRILQTSNLA